MRKAQSWSVDVVVAVAVFGFVTLAISGFVLLSQPETERLERNSQLVIINLAAAQAGCEPVLSGNTLNFDNLECLFGTDYQEFKRDNSIQGDFCVYLEDEEGRVWTLSGGNVTAWGSDDIEIGGLPCANII